MHVLHPPSVALPDARATLVAAAAAVAAAGLLWAEPVGSGSDDPPAARDAPAATAAPAPTIGAPAWRVDPLAPVTLTR